MVCVKLIICLIGIFSGVFFFEGLRKRIFRSLFQTCGYVSRLGVRTGENKGRLDEFGGPRSRPEDFLAPLRTQLENTREQRVREKKRDCMEVQSYIERNNFKTVEHSEYMRKGNSMKKSMKIQK